MGDDVMPTLSIRTRLIFLFTLQILIIFFAGGFYLDWRLRRTLENELADKLQSLAAAAALQVDAELLLNLSSGDEESRTYHNLRSQLQSVMRQTGARRIFVFSQDHRSLVDTEPETPIGSEYVFLEVSQEELQTLFSGQSTSSPLFEGSDGRLYKTGFAPIFFEDEVAAGLALEAGAETLDAIQTVRRDLLLLGAAVLLGSIILGFLFSQRITIPINRLKMAAQRIARGDYETPIDIKRADEIGFLGHTMEEMRRAIVQRDIRQKAMLAGVAHEIRNPLGGIELFAGLLASELQNDKQKKAAEKILKEVQNLKKVVTDFLDYARPNQSKKEHCRVKDVFQEAQMLMAHELNGIRVEYSETEAAQTVWVDPQHLKRIFLNLMKNSVQAMSGVGAINLSVTARDRNATLSFSDSGPGIPLEIREQIFEPFFTKREGGTGLGLAIVKSLVEENGGIITVADGEGARFEIVLPR
jgi:signal transduction histidine kinase